MKAFKSRLTKIKNLIAAKIPDGDDVFGFPGISKNLLVATCQEIYQLSDEIEAREDGHNFEIVVLKRFESEIHERLSNFLENEVDSSKAKDKFDKFLNDFSRLYEKTKQVYFIVNKNGLKDDLEIANLREQIAALTAKKLEYETLIADLAEQAKSASNLFESVKSTLPLALNDIRKKTEEANTDAKAVADAKGEVTKWHSSISETFNKIAGWDKQVEDRLTNSTAAKSQLDEHLGTLKKTLAALNDEITKSASLTTESAQTHQMNKELIQEIATTLGDANRVGMAASFKDQMNEMAAVQKRWRDIFIAVMVLFVGVSIYIVAAHLSNGTINVGALLGRLTILTPVIWLAWFSARQYGYANKVREDYAFKYSSAMAYEGYRKAVRETGNQELEKVLIEIAMYNMALNPIRLLDPKHSDHASPFSAFLEQVFERIPGFKKVKAAGGGVTAEVEMTSPTTKP